MENVKNLAASGILEGDRGIMENFAQQLFFENGRFGARMAEFGEVPWEYLNLYCQYDTIPYIVFQAICLFRRDYGEKEGRVRQ